MTQANPISFEIFDESYRLNMLNVWEMNKQHVFNVLGLTTKDARNIIHAADSPIFTRLRNAPSAALKLVLEEALGKL